jgi:hypothetical protein
MEANITVSERVEMFCQNVNEAIDNIAPLTNNERENLFRDFTREAEEISNLLKLRGSTLQYIKYFKLLPLCLKANLTSEQWAYIFLQEKIIALKKEENKILEEKIKLVLIARTSPKKKKKKAKNDT